MAHLQGSSRGPLQPTGISVATTNITRALSEIAERYSFFCHKAESRMFPEKGKRSERVDVLFSLRSDGRPVFSFEIDNDPARAEINRIKIGSRPVQLVPLTNLAVHHRHAAARPRSYSAQMLERAALPPQFLGSLTVTTESYESILEQLGTWIESVFARLRWAPEWGTVLGVASQYQDLVTSGGLTLAVVHLETQAELAWSLLSEGLLDAERAACLTITLARMLQRAGYHRAARRQISRLRKRIPSTSVLSRSTASSAKAVESLLGQTAGSDIFSPVNLAHALNSVDEVYHKSQFLWRSAIPHILSRNLDHIENVILEYRDLVPESTVTQSNIALLRALYAVKWKHGDTRELAADYAINEHGLLADDDSVTPDGTIHGVVGALYLKVAAEISRGNAGAASLLAEIDAFCTQAGVPQTADGLREIRYVLPGAITRVSRERNRANAFKLWPQTNRELQLRLHKLYAQVNRACRK